MRRNAERLLAPCLAGITTTTAPNQADHQPQYNERQDSSHDDRGHRPRRRVVTTTTAPAAGRRGLLRRLQRRIRQHLVHPGQYLRRPRVVLGVVERPLPGRAHLVLAHLRQLVRLEPRELRAAVHDDVQAGLAECIGHQRDHVPLLALEHVARGQRQHDRVHRKPERRSFRRHVRTQASAARPTRTRDRCTEDPSGARSRSPAPARQVSAPTPVRRPSAASSSPHPASTALSGPS